MSNIIFRDEHLFCVILRQSWWVLIMGNFVLFIIYRGDKWIVSSLKKILKWDETELMSTYHENFVLFIIYWGDKWIVSSLERKSWNETRQSWWVLIMEHFVLFRICQNEKWNVFSLERKSWNETRQAISRLVLCSCLVELLSNSISCLLIKKKYKISKPWVRLSCSMPDFPFHNITSKLKTKLK